MAKLERTPEPGFKKKEEETYERWSERTKDLLHQMQEISGKKDPATSPLKNALIQFQVADGYAVYVVTEEEPLTLRHVPYGDEYQADPATIRGVNKNTVRTQLKRAKAFADMVEKADDFYKSLVPGQIVHYHHGFGTYYRCEVVVGVPKYRENAKPQNCLKPIALLGEWRDYDLPRRDSMGSIVWGIAAENIRNGELMTPHESSIWESPRCANKGRLPDPTMFQPIALEVPDMNPEQAGKAALWHRVNILRNILNRSTNDPSEILQSVDDYLATNRVSA